MIEQIAVVDLIDGAVVQQEFKVALQPDAVAERKGQIIHDRFLGGRKPVRILRRQGGEVRVLQVIPFAPSGNNVIDACFTKVPVTATYATQFV